MLYEAAYYVARVYSPVRKQARSVSTCPRARSLSPRERTCLSRGLEVCAMRAGATRGMIERDEGTGYIYIYISADTFAALKQLSFRGGGESESSPRECVCTCRGRKRVRGLGMGELGAARGRDGVNAQFVFRSGGKTRSLHRIARRTRRNSSSSPTFVSSLDSSR